MSHSHSPDWHLLILGNTPKGKGKGEKKSLGWKYLFSENLLCEDCLHSAERAGLNHNLKFRRKHLELQVLSFLLLRTANLFYKLINSSLLKLVCFPGIPVNSLLYQMSNRNIFQCPTFITPCLPCPKNSLPAFASGETLFHNSELLANLPWQFTQINFYTYRYFF